MFPYILIAQLYISLLSAEHQAPLQPPTPYPFTPAFNKLVARSLERWNCPGLAVTVVDGDDTFSKGYGISTFPSKSVTPETLFYTASTTKSFTAAAVSLLIDEAANSTSGERLQWDTPLANLIREDFVLSDEYTSTHATLQDALSHRTGMSGLDLSYGSPNTTVRDVTRNLRNLPMTAEIRTKWQYCNMMYMTISHFIQTWTGIGIGDFFRTRFYEPLGMNQTFFSLKEAQAAAATGQADIATPYFWNNYTQEYESFALLDSSQDFVPSGAGATISNVLDYTKWLRCHMTRSPPLSPLAHQSLHHPRIITSPTSSTTGFRGADAYALGWEVANYRGEEMQWHTGGLPGFVTIMLYFPRLQWGMVMMGNGGLGNAQLVLMFAMIDEMMGVPVGERYDWVPGLEAQEAAALERLKNAEERLFPDAPKGKDAIPLPLPLEAYTGTYHSHAYPPLTLTLTPQTATADTTTNTTISHPPTLYSHLTYTTYPIHLTFTHITSSHFLLYARLFTPYPRTANDDFAFGIDQVSKAEFRIDERGEVAELGLELEGEVVGGREMWWRKRGEGEGEADTPQPNHAIRNPSSDAYSTNDNNLPPFLPSAMLKRTMAPLFARHV